MGARTLYLMSYTLWRCDRCGGWILCSKWTVTRWLNTDLTVGYSTKRDAQQQTLAHGHQIPVDIQVPGNNTPLWAMSQHAHVVLTSFGNTLVARRRMSVTVVTYWAKEALQWCWDCTCRDCSVWCSSDATTRQNEPVASSPPTQHPFIRSTSVQFQTGNALQSSQSATVSLIATFQWYAL